MRLLLLPIALLAGSCATVDAGLRAGTAAETSIPFVASNGISEWRVAGAGAIYIRSIGGRWYLARTMNRCSALDSAITLGFVTSALGELNRYGAIVAEEQRCPIDSLVRSEAPPEKP
jgi:hypothetical protein